MGAGKGKRFIKSKPPLIKNIGGAEGKKAE